MTTVAELPQSSSRLRSRPQLEAEQRFVLHSADWETYEKIGEAIGHRRIRVTYDRGVLEIMTVSGPHEWWKSRIDLVVRLLGAALQIEIQAYGSTTLKRRDQDRGLEPDECYYIGHANLVHGPRDIDLSHDPAPDLGIEIDISRSWLDRVSVYASLGVAEVWSFDGHALKVYHLRPDGTYAVGDQSLSFPDLPLDEFATFLLGSAGQSDNKIISSVTEWVREHVPPKNPE